MQSLVFALENIQTTDGSEEHSSTEILFTYTSRSAECSIMKFKDDNQFIEVVKFYSVAAARRRKVAFSSSSSKRLYKLRATGLK